MRPRKRSIVGLGLAVATLAAVVAERGTRAWLPRAGSVEATTASALSVPDAPIGTGGGRDDAAADVRGELAAQLAAGRAVIDGLDFADSTDTLVPSADRALACLVAAIAAAPGAFLIEVHSAPTGDVIAEQWLTDRRAAVVRARLVAAGIPAERLFAMGFGSTRASRGAGSAARVRIEVSRMP